MAIINPYTDPSVKFTNDPVPDDCKKPISTVKKTLTGDSVLLSLQLPASSYHVHVSMTALSDMRLPSVECSYSYRTFASTEDRAVTHLGSTSNTVSSKPVNVKAGESVSYRLNITTNGGTVNVALRGASHGVYSCECKVYKII